MGDTVTTLIATYNLPLVVLSIGIAIVASYTALDLVGRVSVAQGRDRQLWLIGGAIALGIGIWSMHFIGMLAYELPIPVSYDFAIVLVSMVVAIIASGMALFIVSRQQLSIPALIAGGIFMGFGIAAMHYIGMAAMRLRAIAHYNQTLVALSVVIAIGASLVALWLAFQLRDDNTMTGSVRRFGSAIVMGNAIAGMYYTAMAAVSFTPSSQSRVLSFRVIDNSILAMGIAVATAIVLAIAMLASIFDQRLNVQVARAEALRQSEERFRCLLQNTSDIIVIIAADGTINSVSVSVKRILGYTPQDWLGKTAVELVHPEDRDKAENFFQQALASSGTEIWAEFRLQNAAGEARDFEVIANNLLAQPEVAGIVATYRDITVRKRDREELRKSEERYSAFVEQSSEGIWCFELEQPLSIELSEDEQIEHFYQYAYLAECNNAMAQMYGFSSATEIVGLRLGEFLDRADAYNIEYLRNFIRSGYRLNNAESHEFDRHGNLKYFLNTLVGIVEHGVLVRAWGTQLDVTQRKQIEAELNNSQERLTLAQKAAKIGTFEWNIQTDEVTWTEELEALYGLTPGSFGGKYDNWAQKLYPGDRARAEQEVRKAATEGTELDTEFRILWTDGSLHWIAAKAHVFYDDTGKPLRMIGVNMDITKRKQAEEALKDSEERFRKLAEKARVIPWEADATTGKFIYVGPQAVEILGYPLSNWYADNFWVEHIHPEDREWALKYCLDSSASLDNYEFEYRMLAADGRVVWLYDIVNVVRSEDGPQLLRGFLIDITDRKRAETKLRLSEERFRMLLENVKDYAIFLLDTQKRVVSWGAGAENILGYQEVDILGESSSIIFTPEDLERGEDKKELNKAVTEGRAENERWHVRKDGTRFWGNGIMAALRDESGQLQGFAKIMRDFTERKQAEEEREQLLAREQAARAEAEAANRIKDEFLATLSHELRTPLNAMLGWTQLLRTRNFNEETTARALETIDRNTKSLAQLIEDVLDVSRIITGKFRMNVCPVELVPIIEAAIETVRTAADAKQIQIQSGLDSSVGTILGDANRLQQVVWNLLSNAVKFTPRGGRVEVRLERINSRVQIRVSDTGQGISPEFLPYVFDRFRQADSSMTRVHGGLGLGLAIVRHVVELHGGTVYAESPGLGQGATFIVELPFMAVDVLATSKLEQVQPKLTDEMPNLCPLELEGLKVLVVDDEPDARDLIATVLGQCGAEVEVAASAVEALETIEKWQPDVLVSDIGMPGEDGYTLIRKLRALEAQRGGQIPAVALTAYARAEDRTQALLAGFQLHVPKPVDPSELAVVVGNLVGRNNLVSD